MDVITAGGSATQLPCRHVMFSMPIVCFDGCNAATVLVRAVDS
jgi:hypothetical protein